MTPVRVLGWECKPVSETWRVTHVSVSVPYQVVSTSPSVRVVRNRSEVLFDCVIPPGSSFDVDIDVVLNPGDVLTLEGEDPADCCWSVISLTPDAELAAAELAAGVGFAERLYSLEQPAVQQAVDSLFADWSEVHSLQETEEARLRREITTMNRAIAEQQRRGLIAREAAKLPSLAEKQPPQPRPTRKIRLK